MGVCFKSVCFVLLKLTRYFMTHRLLEAELRSNPRGLADMDPMLTLNTSDGSNRMEDSYCGSAWMTTCFPHLK